MKQVEMLQEKFAWDTRDNVLYDAISRATLYTYYATSNIISVGCLVTLYSELCFTIFKVKPRKSFTSKISLVSLERSIKISSFALQPRAQRFSLG